VNRRKYNVNALAGIDVAIFNVLYNSCIYQFYEIINQEKQAELFRAKFIEAQAMQVLQRRLEASKQRVQILEGTNENLANEVSYLTPKAQYTDEVLQSTSTYTTTQMAKELGISSAKALNKRLHEIKIMFNQSGQWFLYADYCGKDYTTTRSTPRFNENIRQWETDISTVWTEKGRLFLHQLQKDGILK
jgi:phage antirepressor YoqD-like protein